MKYCFYFIYILNLVIRTSGYVNLAYMKPASMNTVLGFSRPQRANDGDATNVQSMSINSCSHTVPSDLERCWWQVNLEKIYLIKQVDIVYRQTFQRRLAGFSIFLSNTSDFKTGIECFHYKSMGLPPITNSWPCSGYGQYVTIYNERNASIIYPTAFDKRAYLELCEVQILGCPYYKYGKNCEFECFCENITCDSTTGVCPGNCRSGYTGSNCNRCIPGKFGKTCDTCGNCKFNAICDPITGECLTGCNDGWQPPTCLQECPNGTFGPSCSKSCGNCIGGQSCHPVTGVCSNGCEIGYIGSDCKSACEPGKFGEGCSRQCGFCKEYTSCDIKTGVCSHGCRSGWQNPLCTEVCLNQTYGENCIYECGHCKNGKTCDRVSGVCFDGCDSGFVGHGCDKVCEIGLHGTGCKNNCGNCFRNESCNHHNGTCPNGCIQGWDPPLCVTCTPGYYGSECKHKCGNCLGQEPCDQRSGDCTNGCEDNWNGTKCDFKIIYEETRFIYIKVLNYPVVIFLIAVIAVCCMFGVVCCLHIVLKQKRNQKRSCIAVAYKDMNSDSTFEINKETSDSVNFISQENIDD